MPSASVTVFVTLPPDTANSVIRAPSSDASTILTLSPFVSSPVSFVTSPFLTSMTALSPDFFGV